MMDALDPRHGTTAGHLAHLTAGEPACPPCVAAKTRYEKIRNLYGPLMVPALGTRRRIHALKAMGHSGTDIAERLGCSYQAVHKLEHSACDKVRQGTAERVAVAYEQMSMTVATGYHRTRIRNKSRARGYVPPLAWDDIDDPDETPSGWQYQPSTRRDHLEELVERGAGITEACTELGINKKAVDAWTRRHGCGHIYVALCSREHVPQGRHNQHTKPALAKGSAA